MNNKYFVLIASGMLSGVTLLAAAFLWHCSCYALDGVAVFGSRATAHSPRRAGGCSLHACIVPRGLALHSGAGGAVHGLRVSVDGNVAVGWAGAHGALHSGAYPKQLGKASTAVTTSITIVWGSLLRWRGSIACVMFDKFDEVVQQAVVYIFFTVGGSGGEHTPSQQHRGCISWSVASGVCSNKWLNVHGGDVLTQLAYGLLQRREIGYKRGCWRRRILVFGVMRCELDGGSFLRRSTGVTFKMILVLSMSLGLEVKAGPYRIYARSGVPIEPHSIGGGNGMAARHHLSGQLLSLTPPPPHPSSCPSPLGCGGLRPRPCMVCWDRLWVWVDGGAGAEVAWAGLAIPVKIPWDCISLRLGLTFSWR